MTDGGVDDMERGESTSGGTGEVDAVLAALAEARTSPVVRVTDVDGVASELARRVEGEVVEGHDGFVDGLDTRLAQLAARTSARAALDRHAEMEADADEAHPVTDVGSLRALVRRIEQSNLLVEASRERVVERASSAADIAVHPDAIRAAADDLVEARSQLAAVHAELEAEADTDTRDAEAASADAAEVDPGEPSLAERVRTPLGRSLAALVLALALAVAVLAIAGSRLAFVLPGCAAVWVTVVLVRRRDGSIDEAKASQNLARVAAFTDQAYGGGVVDESGAFDADGRLRAAEDRLRYAQTRWVDLVGPDADVDDLDRVVQAHDPQFGVDDPAVDAAPTVRAARAHHRRLSAQWKLAWWALDRDVPALDDATAAIDRLEAEGVDVIAVATHAGRQAADRSSFEELAAGRTLDELRADAAAEWPVLVVVDDAGEVDETEFAAGTARLPEDVRVVLVVAAPGEAGDA